MAGRAWGRLSVFPSPAHAPLFSSVRSLPLSASACWERTQTRYYVTIKDLLQQLKDERNTGKQPANVPRALEEKDDEDPHSSTIKPVEDTEEFGGDEDDDEEEDDERGSGTLEVSMRPKRYTTNRGKELLGTLVKKKSTPEAEEQLFNEIMKGEHQRQQDQEKRLHKPTEVGPVKLRMEDLKYFYLWNKRMRQWVIDCKTPRGYFNTQGRWVPRSMFPSYYELVKGTDLDQSIVELQEFKKMKDENPLPSEFNGVYRFGVTEEELKTVSAGETIREFLSFRHAFRKEKDAERIRQAVNKWGRKIGDTGSYEVQIAAITIKIRSMNEYLKKNHKNQVYKRHLQMMIDRRRKLLQCLKKQNAETYFKLLMDIGLRDTVAIRINRKAYK